ncbi:FAD-dependent oxidoreductase [candidate division KSB1 bacterium]|nr:FAD-dependent oxidoreductase [candidate division KSB1 bacterium]
MTRKLKTDILIAGGGASGVCAAIQAARMGVEVVLVEETPWLGGMLTAAGVSAIDGNHHLPSGLWGEFRTMLWEYYGGPDAVKTGWVSNTLFEPHVGDSIFKKMIESEPNIQIYYCFRIRAAITDKNKVHGAEFVNDKGENLSIQAQISIDATEYGDFLALAGCAYRLGREAIAETNESFAPNSADKIIQDLTYTAILKDYGKTSDKTIPKPENYDPAQFKNMCKELAEDPGIQVVDCEKMLDYGRLPNNKFMLNWPIYGNDFYANYVEMNALERQAAFAAAKNFTLCCVYHIQTKLGWKNLGLADDEFPTTDNLPFIPYIRESRRVVGIETLTANDILQPYHSGKYQYGIAVGDYPLDHHHAKAPVKISEDYPDIPAYNVPYGCLVPKEMDGLLVAEKSISVTHIVNGCTRLQPVVMQIGQAAGASAALCVKQQIEPGNINVRELQQILLDAKMWLMPFCDVSSDDPAFKPVQRIGLCGVLKGELIPEPWENKMKFHPDRFLTMPEAKDALQIIFDENIEVTENTLVSYAGLKELFELSINQYILKLPDQNFRKTLKNSLRSPLFSQIGPVTRKEFAILLDEIFNPFDSSL